MRSRSGCCLLLLFILLVCQSSHGSKQELEIRNLVKRDETTSRTVLDTGELLRDHFIALYTLFPICIIECCICIPVSIGLMLGICATVPGCRIYKSMTRKVREEYILEQEAQMVPPSIIPPTTVYPGNMPPELPPYEQYAQD